ncbi:SLOG family protein [Halobacillus sp. MO56]
MKTMVVTGYKPMELGIFKNDDPRIFYIKEALKKKLTDMLEEGLEWVLISGQMGVELWAAEVVMDLKEQYDVQLGFIPPFINQESRWPDEMKSRYEEMSMLADFYKPVYEKEYQGPYQFKAKDQFLVNHSDGALMLYDQDTPGSPDFFRKEALAAEEKMGYKILYITPLDLQETVEQTQMADPDYWSQ